MDDGKLHHAVRRQAVAVALQGVLET